MRIRGSVATILGAVWLLTSRAFAFDPDVSRFQSYEAGTYTLVTRGNEVARNMPLEIARVDALLTKLLKPGAPVRGIPTYILFFPPFLYDRYLEAEHSLGGRFVAGRFANYVLMEDILPWDGMKRFIYHEYSYAFLHTRFRGIHPPWFEEGLATLMENSEIRGTKCLVGLPPYSEYGWMSADRLLRVDKPAAAYEKYRNGPFHVGSWALVHRGLVAEPEFGKRLIKYLEATSELEPIDEALPASFGMSPSQLNDDMSRYLKRPKVKIASIDINPAPIAQQAGKPMSELEVLALMADAMLVPGFAPRRLPEVVDAASRRAPNTPTAQLLRLRLAVRDRDDAALERLLRQMEPRLGDPDMARGAGLALFERVNTDASLHLLEPQTRERYSTRALELLRGVAASRPDDIEAVWAYAQLAALQKRDLNTAMHMLFQMQRSYPGNADLAMAAALLHEARREPGEMKDALRETFRSSNSIEQRRWAKDRLEAAGATLTGDSRTR